MSGYDEHTAQFTVPKRVEKKTFQKIRYVIKPLTVTKQEEIYTGGIKLCSVKMN